MPPLTRRAPGQCLTARQNIMVTLIFLEGSPAADLSGQCHLWKPSQAAHKSHEWSLLIYTRTEKSTFLLCTYCHVTLHQVPHPSMLFVPIGRMHQYGSTNSCGSSMRQKSKELPRAVCWQSRRPRKAQGWQLVLKQSRHIWDMQNNVRQFV